MKSLWNVDGYPLEVLKLWEKDLIRWALGNKKKIKNTLKTSKQYTPIDLSKQFKDLSYFFLKRKNDSLKRLWPHILSDFVGIILFFMLKYN